MMDNSLERLVKYKKTIDVVVSYGDKLIEMGYITPNAKLFRGKLKKNDSREQFRFGCMRVQDNCVGDVRKGYVREPSGAIYEILNGVRTARRLSSEELESDIRESSSLSTGDTE